MTSLHTVLAGFVKVHSLENTIRSLSNRSEMHADVARLGAEIGALRRSVGPQTPLRRIRNYLAAFCRLTFDFDLICRF